MMIVPEDAYGSVYSICDHNLTLSSVLLELKLWFLV